MIAPSERQLFFHLLWITLLLKVGWAAYLPLTGDEAYFYIWAKNPALGYYDHPPMVGWWLSLLLTVSDAQWWLRLPGILLGNIIALGIYLILRRELEERKALLAAMLFLISPLMLVNITITTDTPLIFFSFFSAWSFYLASRSGRIYWYLLAGLLLGAAFMAKYFAVLLGISYGVYILIYRRNRNDLFGLLLTFLGVLPFAALNVWWNYCNCWNNILFNIFNRHADSGLYLGDYLIMLAYMITPPLLWYGWQQRAALWNSMRGGKVFVFLSALPLALFMLLSVKVSIGLHWLLAFYPFIFVALAALLSDTALRRSLKFMAGFSLLHIVALIVIFSLPHDYWENKPEVYDGVLIGFYPEEFLERFREHAADYHWATGSYVDSAILEYKGGKRISIFGDGSKYGRQDDLLTDWRELDGQNIAALLYNEVTAANYQRYFSNSEVVRFPVGKRDFFLLLGEGFRYERYRKEILSLLRNSYYRFPGFLPEGECYFYQRHFPGEELIRLQR